MNNYYRDDLGDLEPTDEEIAARRNQRIREAKIDQRLQQQHFQQYLGQVDAQELENAAKMYGHDSASFRSKMNKTPTREQIEKIDKVIRVRTKQAHAEIFRVMTGEEPLETERVRDTQGRLTSEKRVVEQPKRLLGDDTAVVEKLNEPGGVLEWMRAFIK